MSFFSDLFKGAKSHFSDIGDKIKDDPERLFLGGLTPVGTEVWGGLLGEDWESGTNIFGGQTEEQFQAGEADGINMEPARQVGAVADLIAGFYGGQGAMSGLGNAWGSMGSNVTSANPTAGWQSIPEGLGSSPSAVNPSAGWQSIPDGLTTPESGLSTMDYIKLGNNAMQNMGGGTGQQQQMQPPQGLLAPQYQQRTLQQAGIPIQQQGLLYQSPLPITRSVY